MNSYTVTFLPDELTVSVKEGKTIKESALEVGIEIEGPCGGKGTCGKCKVQIIDLGDSKDNLVLACQTKVTQDLTIRIPMREVLFNRKSEITKADVEYKIDPGVRKVLLKPETPSLENQIGDIDRLINSIGVSCKVKLEVLRSLPKVIRNNTKLITCVLQKNSVIAIEAGNTCDRIYGLAIDIGTTTVVVSLIDLIRGEPIATASATNSQNVFGADVISRIEYSTSENNALEQLQKIVVQVINSLIKQLSETTGILTDEIYQVAVVANTTMNHLFLGIDPQNIAASPYIPVFNKSIIIEAKDIGLTISPHSPIYVLPNVSAYVGADTLGVILATGINEKKGVNLAIDIGTNGEIVLSVEGNLFACSAAAGPAFEGAHIEFGMRAVQGAIEGFKIIDEKIELNVIGNVPAIGICGSGLMDIVAELVRVGIIESNGRIIDYSNGEHLPESIRERLQSRNNINSFVLQYSRPGSSEIVITQKDIREVQLAKAAIRAGIDILLSEVKLGYKEIDQILLAGAFGNYINKNSALSIGMLPPINPNKIIAVGNAAGAGAQLAVLSTLIREKASLIAKQVKYIELSARNDFQEFFMDALEL